MVLIEEQNNQEFWYTEQLSKFIPTNHISRDVVDFVEEHFEDYFEVVSDKKKGLAKYSLKTFIKNSYLCIC